MRNTLGLLFLLTSLLAQNVPPAARVERWQADLKEFVALLKGTSRAKDVPAGQKDLAKLYPTLDADIAAIEADIPRLRDGEIHLRLARLMAGAHVAHNAVFPGTPPQMLPLAFQWLGEGPVVVAASSDYKAVLGTRLVKAGAWTSGELLELLAQYISSETDGWKRVRAGEYLRNGNLLNTLGLVQDGRVELTLEGPEGTRTLPLTLAPSSAVLEWMPLLPRKLHDYYSSQFLRESNAMYIQYNQCANDPQQTFADFVKNVFAQIDENRASRVIVDLRFNTGGNSRIVNPLVKGLAARRKIIGSPLVLIGPITFSSGVWAANEFRENGARLIGEPTGGLLGGYGEAPMRTLTNSRLPVQWTMKHFGAQPEVKPDATVLITAADLRAGRDPVLDAALRASR